MTVSRQSENDDALMRKADALIKSGDPDAAYRLLEPLETAHAGENRFDYLIGIAALDSGRPGKATLALERALVVNPDFAAARMDMARAYYQLGDLPRSRMEFEAVLKQNPSAAARANIERYLNEIDARESGGRTRLSAFVEGTIGHDSNVNLTTNQSQIFVDVIPAIITLDPASLQASDDFYGLTAEGRLLYNLKKDWRLYAGADLRQRGNRSYKNFDVLDTVLRTGAIWGETADQVRFGLTGKRYNLGSAYYSNASMVDTDWRHALSPANRVSLFGQYTRYRFIDPVMQTNDYDQLAIGAGWQHQLPDGKSGLFGSLYHGIEGDVSTLVSPATPSGGRVDGAMQFNGIRMGGKWTINDNASLFMQMAGQRGNYSRINYYFLRQRSDRLYGFVIGGNWSLGRRWTVRPQLGYTWNHSNIDIYGYDRKEVSLTVRRDFGESM